MVTLLLVAGLALVLIPAGHGPLFAVVSGALTTAGLVTVFLFSRGCSATS